MSGSNFSVGDKVKILSDKNRVKSLQNGHGEWISVMEQTLGETGKVKAVLPSGDLRVKVLGTVFTFNPQSVVNPDDSSPEDSDDDTGKELGGLLLAALLGGALESLGQGGGAQIGLLKAAVSGDTSKVKELLKSGVNVNQKTNGTTALHAASNKGHIEIVRMLIEKGADQKILDDDEDTALHCAIHGGRVEVVRFLLSKRAPLNSKNKKKLSPLHLSVLGDSKSVSQLLIAAGADKNTQDEAGDTPVHDVIHKKNTDMLRLLLEKGASVTIINNRGFNALHWASLKDNNEAVRLILERNRQIVDTTKEDGFTALHLAAINDHVQIIETLFELGQASPNVKNKIGQTPLHVAAVKTFPEATRALVTGNSRINLNVKDKDGDTPLHEALRRVDQSGGAQLALLAAVNPLFGLLNAANGNPEGAKQVAIFLVESGADVKIRNDKGELAFDLCSDNDFKVRLSLLLTGTQGNQQKSNGANAGAAVAVCGMCKKKQRDTVFQCGHMFCGTCSAKVNTCPACKKKVTQKIKVFT